MVRLFRVSIPVGSLALLISEILLVAGAFLGATYLEASYDPSLFLFYEGGIWLVLLVTAAVIVGLHFQDLYTSIFVHSRLLLLQQLSLVMGMAFLAMGLLSYVNHNLRMPLHVMVAGSAMTMVALFCWRILYAKYLLAAVGAERLLFVGANPVAAAITEHIHEHPELGMAVIGYVEDSLPPGTLRGGGKVLGGVADLREIADQVNPDRIIVGMSERRQCMPLADLLDLRFRGITIEEASSAYESVCMRISTLDLKPSQLVFSGELGPRRDMQRLQAVYNLVLAFVALVLFLPVLLLAAIGVRLSSRGPILYRQRRVGLGGKTFTLYKFRSMYVNAEEATGAVWASRDDPRVTRFGRFLRRSRFDELPQLFNVLRGEMALVGPRPERPEFVHTLSEKIPYYPQRHCIRPGITGWAQVNHKYGDTLEDTIIKLEYDLYYIKNMSLSLDLYIILYTLKTMLLSRGSQ